MNKNKVQIFTQFFKFKNNFQIHSCYEQIKIQLS